VLERHRDFEENGFHWHLLIKGAEFIPHEVLKEAWRSARHGVAYIVHVEAVRKPHVIGYVTKYLMKSLLRGEKGTRQAERERVVTSLDADGNIVEERYTYTVDLVSKARRIRYSRHFFPENVRDLRARLFADLEQESMEPSDSAVSTEGASGEEVGQSDTSKPGEDEQPKKRPSWSLVEQEEFTQDIREYRRRRRKALLEALIDLHEGRNLSRRVIHLWSYRRNELRWAS